MDVSGEPGERVGGQQIPVEVDVRRVASPALPGLLRHAPGDLLTIMFTDVVGSTRLATERGDSFARETLRAHEQIVRAALASHGGQEHRLLGDGFMAVFSSPRQAVACSITIQLNVEQHNRRIPAAPLSLRIGLHTGEVVEEDGNLYGEAVNAAARIAAKASGGEVLISAVVRQLTGTIPGVVALDRGRFRLKGFAERWQLYRLRRRMGDGEAHQTETGRCRLIGRDAEKARLVRRCEEALSGEGRLVLVGGEAGIGKTRLIEEAAEEARLLEMTTLIGHCYDEEGRAPFGPLVEALLQMARTLTAAELREALDDTAPEIARIVPELRSVLPDIPAPLDMPAAQERRFLFRSLLRFIERSAGRAPLLIVLEDLHWGDAATLLFIEHLSEHLRTLPVLVVCTYRDAELHATLPLTRSMERLARSRLADHITLGRLPREGVAAMLSSLTGVETPRAVVDLVANRTDGVPFFVEEVYRDFADRGWWREGEGWRPQPSQYTEADVPPSIRLVIGQRLGRLSDPVRAALTQVAVVGRAIDLPLLEAITRTDRDTLLKRLDAALRAGLISLSESRGTLVAEFSHELVRQTLLAEAPLPQRQRLHLHSAEAMLRTYGDTAEDHADEIAHHLVRAGAEAVDAAKTVGFLQVAARRALAATAFEEALKTLEIALYLVPEAEGSQRAELLVAQGRAQQGLGRWEESLRCWRAALDAHQRVGGCEGVGRLCAEMAHQLAWSGRMPESFELASRGLSLTSEPRSTSILLAVSGNALGYSGSGDTAKGFITAAVQIARDLSDDASLGFALNADASVRFFWSDPLGCIRVAEQGLECLRAAGDVFTEASLLGFLEMALLWSGRVDEAEALDPEVGTLGERLGNHGAAMCHVRYRALRAIMAGDLAGLERAAEEDVEFCRRQGLPWVTDGQLLLGLTHLWRGDHERALRYLDAAIDATLIDGAFAGGPLAFRLLTLAHLGDDERTREAADALRRSLPAGPPMMMGQLAIVCALVQAMAMIGRRDEAAAGYPLITAHLEAGVMLSPWDLLPMHTLAGIAAAASDDEHAEEHLRTGLWQARELGHRLAEAECRRHYGTWLAEGRRPGDASLARLMLLESADRYGEMGMPRHAALARAALEAI